MMMSRKFRRGNIEFEVVGNFKPGELERFIRIVLRDTRNKERADKVYIEKVSRANV
jgi:hypothetical protein